MISLCFLKKQKKSNLIINFLLKLCLFDNFSNFLNKIVFIKYINISYINFHRILIFVISWENVQLKLVPITKKQ